MMQLPSEATANRTTEVIEQTETIFGQEKAVDTIVAINGFSFFGSGQNAGLAFVTLKDWSERDADNSAQSIAGRATMAMSQIKDAISFALSPPAIQASERRADSPSASRTVRVSARRHSPKRATSFSTSLPRARS